MNPRSLYGNRQEEMKATNIPTYSFWVNSGWTHMNRLHTHKHTCSIKDLQNGPGTKGVQRNSLLYFLQDVCHLPKQILWWKNKAAVVTSAWRRQLRRRAADRLSCLTWAFWATSRTSWNFSDTVRSSLGGSWKTGKYQHTQLSIICMPCLPLKEKSVN